MLIVATSQKRNVKRKRSGSRTQRTTMAVEETQLSLVCVESDCVRVRLLGCLSVSPSGCRGANFCVWSVSVYASRIWQLDMRQATSSVWSIDVMFWCCRENCWHSVQYRITDREVQPLPLPVRCMRLGRISTVHFIWAFTMYFLSHDSHAPDESARRGSVRSDASH